MKKLFKGLIISATAFFIIISASAVKASDDEKPIIPNGTDITKSVDILFN